jgi:mono/diheme cytochrome c family protein
MKLSKYAQYLVFFVAIVLVLAVFAVAAGKGDPAAGKAVYDKRCATCHAAAGEGKPAIAKSLKVELRHLGSKEVQAKSDKDLLKDTTEGIGKMKPEKGLTEQQLADLLAYMRTFKQ